MKNFTQISNAVARDPRLSAKAKGIYLYLSSFPGDWTTSIRAIANDFRDSRDSIQSGLNELIATGHVIRCRVKSNGSHNRINYRVCVHVYLPPIHYLSQAHPEKADTEKPDTDIPDATNTKKKTKTDKKEKSNTLGPSRNGKVMELEKFTEFWKGYPKKADKGHARLAWNQQMRAGFKPDDIIAGLATSPALKRAEKIHIPHPATWLRGEGWDDDPESESDRNPWDYT